jgi:hypothetical protein
MKLLLSAKNMNLNAMKRAAPYQHHPLHPMPRLFLPRFTFPPAPKITLIPAQLRRPTCPTTLGYSYLRDARVMPGA